MTATGRKYVRFGTAIGVILISLGYLAYTGVQESKNYFVTLPQLRAEAKTGEAYTKRLRVGGIVQPGSIKQVGTNADFVLVEGDNTLRVSYKGSEPPPDTFKDNAQALVLGEYGHDGIFHAREIQAKCASKYAPQQGGATASAPASGKGY